MLKWAIIGISAAVLVAAQIKLDLIRVTNEALHKELQKVHVSLPNPMNQTANTLTLTSLAFSEGATIPAKYTCDAGATQPNPPLSISGVPEGTAQLVLIMYDPDVPKQLRPDGVFDHWVVFGIDPTTTEIAEGEAAKAGSQGLNGRGDASYTGPCPPPQYEPSEHRYVFTLYAVDQHFLFESAPTKAEVLSRMEGHILAQTQLIGKYKRK